MSTQNNSLDTQPAQTYTTSGHSRRTFWFFRLLGFILPILLFVACDADGTTIDASICDAYEDSLYSFQLVGGVFIVAGIALMAFKKAVASFLPQQGAQVGAMVSTLAAGVLLLTFSTEWGSRILGIFTLPDMYVLCGLG